MEVDALEEIVSNVRKIPIAKAITNFANQGIESSKKITLAQVIMPANLRKRRLEIVMTKIIRDARAILY